jgi:hypothetical protein
MGKHVDSLRAFDAPGFFWEMRIMNIPPKHRKPGPARNFKGQFVATLTGEERAA